MRPLIFLIGVVFIGFSVSAQNGESLFNTNCTACHKLNSRLVGPPLAGVHKKQAEAWLIKFIKSPADVINGGDAYANELFNEYNKVMMPNQALSDDEIKSILAYIKENSPEDETGNSVSSTPETESEEPEFIGNSNRGQELFVGNTRFENGGASCNSCHHVMNDSIMAGGLLAKDLTEVYSRMGSNEAALMGYIKSPAAPMATTYKNNPLTDQEVADLAAFLAKANMDKIYQHPWNPGNYLLYGGVIGAIILFSVFAFLSALRKKDTVNKKIYDRQIRSFN